jgi:hypothetical protein
MPGHALLQLPDHRSAVRRKRAVLAAGNAGRQHGAKVAVVVPAGQRFIEQPAGFANGVAAREMRIEQGRALPQDQSQGSATAAFGGLVARLRFGHHHARLGQQLPGHRCRPSHQSHSTNERPSGQSAGLDPPDQAAQLVLFHQLLRFSRMVRPAYSVRNRPRRWSSGTTIRPNSSNIVGNRLGMRTKPSPPPASKISCM